MDGGKVRKFKTFEPNDPIHNDFSPVVFIWTEQDILNFYWEHWSSYITEVDWNETSLDKLKQACIEDWQVIHWAEEI